MWIMMLGGSGPNVVHIAFYAGAHAVDGVSWRNAALRKEIIIPERGIRALGNSKRKRLTYEDLKELSKWWDHELNPFKDIKLYEFLSLAMRNDTVGFHIRGLWNAAALKIEETIANEFANDPDRYYRYLVKRWKNNSFWRNVLKIISTDYVQNTLTVFLRI